MQDLMKVYEDFSEVISTVMKQLGYEFDLVIYGSTVNGLAVRGDSDLDLSLVIHNLPHVDGGKEKAR